MKKFVVIIVVAAVVMTGCAKKVEPVEQVAVKKVAVVNIAPQSELNREFTASGTAVPKQHTIMRSLTNGTLAFILPVGSAVKAGQPLFQLTDANIESAYFNAAQNFQQTQVLAEQRVKQASLGLSSAKARQNSVTQNLATTKKQLAQSVVTIRDSAKVNYQTAYNQLHQIYTFLTDGIFADAKFRYRNVVTTDQTLRENTTQNYLVALQHFVTLEPKILQDEVLESELEKMQTALQKTKTMLDVTAVLLQLEVSSSVDHSADKPTIANYQAAVNQHFASTLGSVNALRNAEISNQLAIEQLENQIQLSQIEVDNARVAVQNAQDAAELEKTMAQRQLSAASYAYENLSLNSPFDGTVLTVFTETGEQVSGGQQLIELGNLSILEIETAVDNSFAQDLKIGDKVLIEERFEGIISLIDPSADPQSGKTAVTVQTAQQSETLTAGQVVDVRFTISQKLDNPIIIPINAATIDTNETYVYVLADGKAQKRPVTLGKLYDNQVTVASGLAAGDVLILRDDVFVTDGEAVEAK